jgi:hypothetical protein
VQRQAELQPLLPVHRRLHARYTGAEDGTWAMLPVHPPAVHWIDF